MTPLAGERVSMLDVCSGSTKHLNLRHVSRLESKLCKLLVKLEMFAATLHVRSRGLVVVVGLVVMSSCSPNRLAGLSVFQTLAGESPADAPPAPASKSPGRPASPLPPLASPFLGPNLRARVAASLADCLASSRSVAHDLLSLAVLVPAAPVVCLCWQARAYYGRFAYPFYRFGLWVGLAVAGPLPRVAAGVACPRTARATPATVAQLVAPILVFPRGAGQGELLARFPPGMQKNASVRTVLDDLLKVQLRRPS